METPPTLDTVDPSDLTKPWRGSVLIKSIQETPEGDWLVSGPISSLEKDYDEETMRAAGVIRGLRTFIDLGGTVDWEHRYHETNDLDDVIGEAFAVALVDGVPWLTTKLYKDNLHAQKLWKHLKAGRKAGYSLEGKATLRDRRDPNHVLDMVIHRVTIAMNPKGFIRNTRVTIGGMPLHARPLDMMMKALVAEARCKTPGDFGWTACGCDVTPGVTDVGALRKGYGDEDGGAGGGDDGTGAVAGNGGSLPPLEMKGLDESGDAGADADSGESLDDQADTLKATEEKKRQSRGLIRCQSCGTRNDVAKRDDCRHCGASLNYVRKATGVWLRKALMAGGGIVADQDTGGPALRKQELLDKMPAESHGTCGCGCGGHQGDACPHEAEAKKKRDARRKKARARIARDSESLPAYGSAQEQRLQKALTARGVAHPDRTARQLMEKAAALLSGAAITTPSRRR